MRKLITFLAIGAIGVMTVGTTATAEPLADGCFKYEIDEAAWEGGDPGIDLTWTEYNEDGEPRNVAVASDGYELYRVKAGRFVGTYNDTKHGLSHVIVCEAVDTGGDTGTDTDTDGDADAGTETGDDTGTDSGGDTGTDTGGDTGGTTDPCELDPGSCIG